MMRNTGAFWGRADSTDTTAATGMGLNAHPAFYCIPSRQGKEIYLV